MTASEPQLSVVICVSSRFDPPEKVYLAYSQAIRATGHNSEFIYVLDGPQSAVAVALRALQCVDDSISVVPLSERQGEAACLRQGIIRARGRMILILPPYFQVTPDSLPILLNELDGADLVAAGRDRYDDHALHRMRGWAFRQLWRIAGSNLQDPGCVVRACRREVLDEISVDGQQHRFLPLLAERAGFVVKQILLPQAPSDRRIRIHRPFDYVENTLDLIAMAFLLKFMQKPFRFFGTIGLAAGVSGVALGLILAAQRLFWGVGLADRPLLLLSVLLVVLGIQIGAIGLIAEIIIFTRSNRTPAYRVREIVESERKQEGSQSAPGQSRASVVEGLD